MAKLEIPSLWLGPSVPHILSVDGEHGETKEFSFRLHLNFNALRTIERYTGIAFSNPLKFFEACQQVQNQTIMFWAATHAYHPEYKDDKALDFFGSILNYRNSGAANDAVFEAFLKSLPDTMAAKLRKLVEDQRTNEDAGEKTSDPQPTAPAEKN